jgi:hypothetical protein
MPLQNLLKVEVKEKFGSIKKFNKNIDEIIFMFEGVDLDLIYNFKAYYCALFVWKVDVELDILNNKNILIHTILIFKTALKRFKNHYIIINCIYILEFALANSMGYLKCVYNKRNAV